MPGVKMEKVEKLTAPAHPKVSVMVETAIKTLAERKGSSMQAINKFIGENYSVDVKKISYHIKKCLKAAVESGDIVQTSGRGATGSFKIGNKKTMAKPKAPKVKSEKPLKMQTSTPMKSLKPKKALLKSPNKKPVQKTNLASDRNKPADTNFTKPSKVKKPRYSIPSKSRKSKVSLPTKIKKPKTKTAKQPKAPKVKPEKPQKMQTSTPMKSLKPKKALVKSPNKSPVHKTNIADDRKMSADTTFEKLSKVKKPRYSIPSKSRKSKVSLPRKIKKPKTKADKQPKATASSEKTPDDAVTSPKPIKAKGVTKSTKAKKSPKSKKPALN